MKKIFFLLMIFISLKSFAQHPIGNDSFQLQTLGSSNTFIKSKAAIGSDSGFVNAVYVDTAAANRGKIKNYPGAQIRVGDSIWVRNSTATGWINNTAGGSVGIAAETDPLSVHITDSSAMLTPYVRGGSIAWPGTIYNTPTTATYSGHILTFSPSLANQSAYTLFGRASGTGVPSFLASIDSNWIPTLHSEAYYNTKYSPIWTLTTTGTSGAATYTGNVLNIPNYATGILSLSAIGASPNANAATITGSTLNLEPASVSFGGVITTGTQTFAGDKTFTGHLAVGATSAISALQVVSIKETFTDGNNNTGLSIAPTFLFTADNANNFRGTTGAVTANLAGFNLTNTGGGLIGNQTTAVLNSTGTLTAAMAYFARVDNTSTGTITNAYGIKVVNNTNSGGGTITGSSGVWIQNQTVGTNNSNLVLGIANTVPTGNYNIYSASTYDSKFLGNVLMAARLQYGKGANIAAANNLTLGADGNVFTITGNTQINAITTTNWQAGSVIRLIFSGTPTVKNNTAGGANTAPFLLSGSVDFVAAANDILTVIYDGTNWHEGSRKTTAQAAWLLASGGTLTGVNTITSNVVNQLNYTGAYTTTATGQGFEKHFPTITFRGTTTDTAYNMMLQPNYVQGANTQYRVNLFLTQNNTAGAFAGGADYSIVHDKDIIPLTNTAVSLGSTSRVYLRANATNVFVTNIETSGTGSVANVLDGASGNLILKIKGASVGNSVSALKIGSSVFAAAALVGGYTTEVGGGMSSYGDNVIRQLATPPTPTVVVNGATGTTTFTYKLVGRMQDGTTTEASASSIQVTNGNATLSGSNFNRINFTEITGCPYYDVYLTQTSGAATLGKVGSYVGGSFFNGGVSHTLNTQGDGNTAPTTNTTGSMVVGGTTALGALTLRAGVAGAMGAPLVFQSGTDLTTGVDGAVNWDGTDLKVWDGTTKYTINKSLTGSATLDFPSTLLTAVADLTITVTGAADGDVVSLGVPNGSVTATATYTAWVSAANTVTVRFSPKATEDPASGTFKVRVVQ